MPSNVAVPFPWKLPARLPALETSRPLKVSEYVPVNEAGLHVAAVTAWAEPSIVNFEACPNMAIRSVLAVVLPEEILRPIV
jgi:hypothetical protein